ncbi:hypothetical protein A6R68_07228, partial [Neotoma lepida]
MFQKYHSSLLLGYLIHLGFSEAMDSEMSEIKPFQQKESLAEESFHSASCKILPFIRERGDYASGRTEELHLKQMLGTLDKAADVTSEIKSYLPPVFQTGKPTLPTWQHASPSHQSCSKQLKIRSAQTPKCVPQI